MKNTETVMARRRATGTPADLKAIEELKRKVKESEDRLKAEAPSKKDRAELIRKNIKSKESSAHSSAKLSSRIVCVSKLNPDLEILLVKMSKMDPAFFTAVKSVYAESMLDEHMDATIKLVEQSYGRELTPSDVDSLNSVFTYLAFKDEIEKISQLN